jgi:hypothetical protein
VEGILLPQIANPSCHGFQLLVIHVSRKRMQAQWTDGVLRGQLLEGMMNGETMMPFMPLHEMALECSPKLKEWLKEFISPDIEFLLEEGWSEREHNNFEKVKGARGWPLAARLAF